MHDLKVVFQFKKGIRVQFLSGGTFPLVRVLISKRVDLKFIVCSKNVYPVNITLY